MYGQLNAAFLTIMLFFLHKIGELINIHVCARKVQITEIYPVCTAYLNHSVLFLFQ